MLSCWCAYCSSVPEEPRPSIGWILNAPMFLRASPSPLKIKKTASLSSPNPFLFCSSSSDLNEQKGNRSEKAPLLSAWSAHASGKASKRVVWGKRALAGHSSKMLLLLVHRPALKRCEYLQALWQTGSGGSHQQEQETDRWEGRQTITGQVYPLYPSRAGQRKWRNLWCHKKVPEEECLRTGCLWSCSHKRLLQLLLPPRPPPETTTEDGAPPG